MRKRSLGNSGLEVAPLAFGAPGSRQAGTNLNASSVIWEWTGVEHRVVVWPPRFARSSIQAIPLGT